MDEKFKEVSKLMKEIKRKIEAVAQSSAHIKEFNYKVEALLAAFDAYTSHIPESSLETDRASSNAIPSRKIIQKESTREDVVAPPPKVRKEESFEEFMRRMESSTASNKVFRTNATKIAKFLYGNKDGAALEEIIKHTGISRYRCVDILNSMLRTDPPLASKRFDKGFIYSIALL
ncbi:hypothetical protein EHEL_021210 [Encephalitozoon hellem ATCC 50504]|uniref:Uncharacterized protein n=1 Tax=Encephalitozoon hellem TaxID=27973 RepID=A0A9Q9F7T4_ENCHE|nr:uncharacterized protein EHEL_021210 [Encephalitozoon hellem ATCC 50504]AFM97875.1 hypothetical protein EHEL_021210 [Encephalitozoon hellem ATCC 50504]UTX42653.1 hypothetical protein GPU96_02g03680 [Encephalitozoon hellem]WEL38110.1 hypothetical protein PFJ87_02g01500 [Encephalitozoon hellem]|eukprot:XP_003886856.1 hypothetical protein EHEL_021210 [Encephalitozoon hellem ATCC 50504]